MLNNQIIKYIKCNHIKKIINKQIEKHTNVLTNFLFSHQVSLLWLPSGSHHVLERSLTIDVFFLMDWTRLLFSPASWNTQLFIFRSIHLTFNIFRQHHISKLSNLLIVSLDNVHISAPYVATLQIKHFINHLRRSYPISLERISLFSINNFLAIAILALVSSIVDPSSVITDPKYTNLLTCSTLSWSINILAVLGVLLTIITFVFPTFIFILNLFAVVFSLSIICCSSASLLAIIAWSYANLISLVLLPPTLIPKSQSSKASTIIFSTYRKEYEYWVRIYTIVDTKINLK